MLVAVKAAAPGIAAAVAPAGIAAAIALSVMTSYDPHAEITRTFKQEPELVAECMSRNALALKPFYLQVRPLRGLEVMGLTLKRSTMGEPMLVVVVTAAQLGSTAEFRPLLDVEQPAKLLDQLTEGCA